MPFICERRTDIPNGVLQVSDLWPNKSKTWGGGNPVAQGPRYLRKPVSETVVTTANADQRTITNTVSGLAAYLIANIENQGVGTPAITATQANTIAAALLTRMRTVAAMAEANMNTVIAATVALSGIGIGNSTASVIEILSILSGRTYTLPAGYEVQDAGAAFVPMVDNDAYFNEDTYTYLLGTDSVLISADAGSLSKLSSSAFTYAGTTGAAVVVYDDTGAVFG